MPVRGGNLLVLRLAPVGGGLQWEGEGIGVVHGKEKGGVFFGGERRV